MNALAAVAGAFMRLGPATRRPAGALAACGRRGDNWPNTGRLAQLVERLLYTQDVGGSIPSPPTILLRAFGHIWKIDNQTKLAIYGPRGNDWEGVWTFGEGREIGDEVWTRR